MAIRRTPHPEFPRRIRPAAPAVLAFLSICLLAPSGAARVLTVGPDVGPDGFRTIQAALAGTGQGDTVLVMPGVYPEELRPRTAVTIEGVAGAESTFVDGEGIHRTLFAENVDLVLIGLTFRNGRAGTPGGGAAFIADGSVRIRSCAFRNNLVEAPNREDALGGAIYCRNGETRVYVEDCIFTDNECRGVYGYAGAIGFGPGVSWPQLPPQDSLLVSHCSFLRNRAQSFPGIFTETGIVHEGRHRSVAAGWHDHGGSPPLRNR